LRAVLDAPAGVVCALLHSSCRNWCTR
jgi:hypothetical protein